MVFHARRYVYVNSRDEGTTVYINKRELQHLMSLIGKLEERDDIPYVRGIEVDTENRRNVIKLYSAGTLDKIPFHTVRAVWIEGGMRFDHFEEVTDAT